MPSLSEILRTKLIPWSRENASERFIVARSRMHQAEMPYGVQLLPHKIQSKRVLVKNRRVYNNVRNTVAEWPEAGLQELGKYLFICVLDGHIDYTVGNYKLQCGPGHFIFIPPGTPCPDGSQAYVDRDKSAFCDIASFLLHPDALECWTSHCDSRGRKRSNNCLVMHERSVSLFQALMEEVTAGEKHALQIGEALLNAFLTVLQRELEAGKFQSYHSVYGSQMKTTAPSKDFVTHLEQYVQDNLRRTLTLDVVSAEMYLSPAQFSRVIRRETGKSFNQYLAIQRIEEAKNLLRTSQWTVTVVAKFCGFNSPSYFRTFFKRHAGMTPLEFRMRESEKR